MLTVPELIQPVIYYTEDQPAKYVKESGCGVVVRPGDYKALIEAVLFIKKNGDVAESMEASGGRYV